MKTKGHIRGLYRRPESPYWWAAYTDENGHYCKRSTKTKDKQLAIALLNQWREEANLAHWGILKSTTLDNYEPRRAPRKREHATSLSVPRVKQNDSDKLDHCAIYHRPGEDEWTIAYVDENGHLCEERTNYTDRCYVMFVLNERRRVARGERKRIAEMKWLEDRHQKEKKDSLSGYLFHDDRQVYFIRSMANGLIKIGSSDNVDKRIIGIQGQSPTEIELVACTKGGYRLERFLHDVFKKANAHGEWFHPVRLY